MEEVTLRLGRLLIIVNLVFDQAVVWWPPHHAVTLSIDELIWVADQAKKGSTSEDTT